MSVRLYVGNLPAELDRQELEKIFNESGETFSLKVITDRKTGRCRGFGFVTVNTPEAADTVIDKFNGYDFNGTVLKLEKALPRAKGKGEGEGEGEAGESGANPATAAASNNPRPAKRKKKTNRSGATADANQPDPRWASQLEQLKQQLLAAQTTT
ncbi:RNP-1 like RNA-binding protein [Thalassoporum mexicanum PCC 7367]|uniref:RNA recognition motif domain-containing protein n=1 Tax=Thalassoporum mexicanum TaxID=3457544 RepID=UPI00029FFCC4|nr:RNA-binding protein [Pseudanabaena sp. PCC 7367]AFY68977.1 RNP-1 like RNA-binding protein [Pseudanabaena sp. PCC 7367]